MSNNEDKEAYDRWQGFRINQLGVCIALFLAFAVATLGFSVNLLVEHTNVIGGCLAKVFFLFSLGFGLLSLICGSAACLTRLADFRKTAQVARHRSDPGMASIIERWREKSDKLGEWTWGLFWSQLICFGLQAFLLTFSLGITYWPQLFTYSNGSSDVMLAGVAAPQVSPGWVQVIGRRGPYAAKPVSWVKILNPSYSQMRGRQEMFANFRTKTEPASTVLDAQ